MCSNAGRGSVEPVSAPQGFPLVKGPPGPHLFQERLGSRQPALNSPCVSQWAGFAFQVVVCVDVRLWFAEVDRFRDCVVQEIPPCCQAQVMSSGLCATLGC